MARFWEPNPCDVRIVFIYIIRQNFVHVSKHVMDNNNTHTDTNNTSASHRNQLNLLQK